MLVAQKLPLPSNPYAKAVTLSVANDNDEDPTMTESRPVPPRPRPGSVTRAKPRAIARRAAPLTPPRPRTRDVELLAELEEPDAELSEEAEPEEADVTPSMILGADEVAAVVAQVDARAGTRPTSDAATALGRAGLRREAVLLPLTLCFFIGFAALVAVRWAAARLASLRVRATDGWRDVQSHWARAREAAVARTRG